MEVFVYCPECLNLTGKLIRYAMSQRYCAVCESEQLVMFLPSQSETPTLSQVLADRATSMWLKNALSSALTRDPVDAANDAEVMSKVLAGRCQRLLVESSNQQVLNGTCPTPALRIKSGGVWQNS